MSSIVAVHGPARATTVWTTVVGLCAVRGDVEKFRAAARDALNAAARHRKIIVHALAMGTISTVGNLRFNAIAIHAK